VFLTKTYGIQKKFIIKNCTYMSWFRFLRSKNGTFLNNQTNTTLKQQLHLNNNYFWDYIENNAQSTNQTCLSLCHPKSLTHEKAHFLNNEVVLFQWQYSIESTLLQYCFNGRIALKAHYCSIVSIEVQYWKHIVALLTQYCVNIATMCFQYCTSLEHIEFISLDTRAKLAILQSLDFGYSYQTYNF